MARSALLPQQNLLAPSPQTSSPSSGPGQPLVQEPAVTSTATSIDIAADTASYLIDPALRDPKSYHHYRSATDPFPVLQETTPASPAQPTGRTRSRTTHSVNLSPEENDPLLLESADEDGSPKAGPKRELKKMFVCSGYGACSMSFSRAEHLARHVR